MVNDFLVDEDGDELIVNGDYVIGPSDSQHIDDIIISVAGAWREFPTVGVGVQEYQSGPNEEQKLRAVINQQLKADGYADIIVLANYLDNSLDVSVDANRILTASTAATTGTGAGTAVPSGIAGSSVLTQTIAIVGPPGAPGPAGAQGPAGPAGPGITDEQVIALSLLFG